MKRVGASLVFAFGLVVALNFAAPNVSAQKFNPENKIEVKGRVLPARHVVVDSSGKIIEIISNTTEDVPPKLYTDRLSNETEVPMTDEVLKQFERLVPAGTSKPGILYKHSDPPLMQSATSVMSMLLKF